MKECLLYTSSLDGPQSAANVNCNSREILDKTLVVNCANCTNTNTWCINNNRTGRLDYYFLYLISSDFLVETPDGKEMMYEGDIVVIPPRKPYTFTPTKGKPIYYLCVHVTGNSVEKMLNEYGIKIFPNINKLSSNHHLQERFKKLFDAFAKNDEFRENELANLTERIFIEAARAIKAKNNDKIALSRSIRYINEFYTTKVIIPDLARMESMSVTSYNREFKKQLNVSPTKYIINKRIQLAKELLETTSMSITEISLTCGYNDINFFSRVFKEIVSCSPTSYKQKINADF